MKRDPRVHLDPTTRRYHEGVAQTQQRLAESVPPEAWAPVLAALSAAVIAHARATEIEIVLPDVDDPRLTAAADSLLGGLRSGERREDGGELRSVLERRLAEYTGTHVPEDPAIWPIITETFRDWQAWIAFAASIPDGHVNQAALELVRPMAHERCFESFGQIRDNLARSLRHLDERRAAAHDVWDWLETVDQFSDEATLSAELALTSALLARIDVVAWLSWAMHLPHALFSAIAVNDVDDPDFLEKAVAHCHEAMAPRENRSLVLFLLIRRTIEIWDACAKRW